MILGMYEHGAQEGKVQIYLQQHVWFLKTALLLSCFSLSRYLAFNNRACTRIKVFIFRFDL